MLNFRVKRAPPDAHDVTRDPEHYYSHPQTHPTPPTRPNPNTRTPQNTVGTVAPRHATGAGAYMGTHPAEHFDAVTKPQVAWAVGRISRPASP